ncbi:extensin family protein [Maritalea mobilis]|uniref:extensin-like domain-containing protein n=1 Tax=Maritalea mobilis TaxID=483324 RepID=UPI001C98C971|nr:extensin family protein [Maritalea mobilis]MBY6201218.1 extensin family protein [Maritalea mobilis]
MKLRAAILGGALALAAVHAAAEAPDRSPRPIMRGEAAAPAVTRVVVAATARAPSQSLRPVTRPGAAPIAPTAEPDAGTAPAATPAIVTESRRPGLFSALLPPRRITVVPGATALAVAESLRPVLRPAGLETRVRAAATRQTPGRVTQPGRRGQLCGRAGLEGDRLETITGRITGCGIAEPVRLRAVDGIPLTTPATINCDTATALQDWVQQSVVPTVGRRGGGVANIRVIASYSCRTRNSQPGARLSEHALGNAVDIAGIGLANGSELTVLGGWRDRSSGPLLQAMHQGACGPFGTVLGPNSDRFHQDHFHLDVASYRSGSYCR